MDGQLKRKWENPTSWTVGAVILDDDNKPKGMPVGPGESIWLTAAEERLTAEAPRLAKDNPFVKEWECPVDFNSAGEPIAHETRKGVLVLSDEPPREITSSRFIPSTPAAAEEPTVEIAAGSDGGNDGGGDGQDGEGEPEKDGDATEHTGAPPLPNQPPTHGKPAPDEQVATPGAVPANDEYLAKQKREELERLETDELADAHARLAEDDPARAIAAEILRERASGGEDGERRTSAEEVAESGPKGAEEIGARKEAPAIV